jgi:quercetin dioxygenase-like cupin family protein
MNNIQKITESRQKLFALQEASSKMEQVECPLIHTFVPGMYARQIFVPKGTTVVTKIHNQRHLTFILKGKCIVHSDGETKTIEAPMMFITEPGTKRAVHVLEDTIWVTVHHNPNDETDLDKIEEFVIAKDFDHIRGPDARGELSWHG